MRLYAVRLINEKFKKMNIQTELQKIHHQFGVSEKANYEIQKLFDKSIKKAVTEALRKNAVSQCNGQLMATLTSRLLTIKSEPDGIVRETMIDNLLVDINCG